MKNVLEYIVNTFGFENLTEFASSMIHFKFLILTIPTSIATFAIVEQWLGITSAMLVAFVVLAMLELITGLWGARVDGEKWSSSKFGRFGLKLGVWLSLIFVAHSFANSYVGLEGLQNYLNFQLFYWLHGVITTYVALEYILSILENFGRITGQKQNRLLLIINNRLDSFLGSVERIDADIVKMNNRIDITDTKQNDNQLAQEEINVGFENINLTQEQKNIGFDESNIEQEKKNVGFAEKLPHKP